MKKILVPVDYSDTSLNALNYAIRLFESQSLEITILHTCNVIRASAFSMKMKSINRVMKEDAEREMENLIMRLEEQEPDVIFKSRIINSNATSGITQLGDSGNYDFIVMGTKGASGLKEVFIGSVAGWVISKTKAPVIVVPGSYRYQPLKEIVCAISGNFLSNATVLDPLRKLAAMHSCNINLLHISEDEEEEGDYEAVMEQMIEILDDFDPTLTYAPDIGDVNESMNTFIKKQDAGLLCLVRGKKGYLNRLFFESVTLKQTFNSIIPLLILHN